MRVLIHQPRLKKPKRSKITPESQDVFLEHEEQKTPLNYYVSPDVNTEHLLEEMERQFNATSGSIDQAFLYLDTTSARDWRAVANEQHFLSTMGDLPASWLVEQILLHLSESESGFDQNKIRIIALGPGEGRVENQVIGAFVSKRPALKIHCSYVDMSAWLLKIAKRNADRAFGSKKNVVVDPIEGDFFHLPQMSFLFDRSKERPRQLRVCCMLGYTFVSLPSELQFIQESLRPFEKGDLLVLDVCLAYAPANDPEKILAVDPRFGAYPWQKTWERWVRGSIERYRPGAKQITIQSILDNRLAVPNSYSVVIRAIIDDQAQLTLFRIKRYEQEGLLKVFEDLRWKPLAGKKFGEDNLRLVYIFEKQ